MVNKCGLAEETWQSQQDGIRINKLEDTFCHRIFSAALLQGQTWRSARQTTMPKTKSMLKLVLIRFNRTEISVQSSFISSVCHTDLHGLLQHNRTDALWFIYTV